MSCPVLHDAVTLRHFGEVNRLDLVRACHERRPLPRWAAAVHAEIDAAARSEQSCVRVLAEKWLDEPQNVAPRYLEEVARLQKALNDLDDPPRMHLGEAESIVLARQLGAEFVTDDNTAYDLAKHPRQLGMGRVFDSVDILRRAVADGELTGAEASAVYQDIRTAGRSFRREHPEAPDARYFDR